MLRKDGKIELLKRSRCFRIAARSSLRRSRASPTLIDPPGGTPLIREGAVGRDFMLIVHGAVEVRRKGRKITSSAPGIHRGDGTDLGSSAKRDGPAFQGSTFLVVTDREFWELLERAPDLPTA